MLHFLTLREDWSPFMPSDLEIARAVRLRGGLPVCVAKTQYSFSEDPSLLGAPVGHRPTIREVRLSAGAGFIVVLIRTSENVERNSLM